MEKISGIRKHVGVLERRVTYLERRISDGRLSPSSEVFEKRELRAIEAGCQALHLAERYQDVATSPVLALEELVESWDDSGMAPLDDERLLGALAHARTVLAMIDSSGD